MGKYIRKSKMEGEAALMEVVSQSSLGLGVRTRAKSLALQRGISSATSYLQLRSRRLQKTFPVSAADPRKSKEIVAQSPELKSNLLLARASLYNYVSVSNREVEYDSLALASDRNSISEMGLREASVGENIPAIDESDRSMRETTPSSKMRGPEIIITPVPKPSISVAPNNGRLDAICGDAPAAYELEEFFADAEREQQRKFIDKYNYDPVNDRPLPGRYEWLRLNIINI